MLISSRSQIPSALPTPGRVGRLIDAVGERVGDFGLGAHFHNTRGAGLACAFAAVQHGVRNLDASTGGLGGWSRSLPVPVATSRRRNWSTCSKTWALRQVSTWMRAFVPLPLQRR